MVQKVEVMLNFNKYDFYLPFAKDIQKLIDCIQNRQSPYAIFDDSDFKGMRDKAKELQTFMEELDAQLLGDSYRPSSTVQETLSIFKAFLERHQNEPQTIDEFNQEVGEIGGHLTTTLTLRACTKHLDNVEITKVTRENEISGKKRIKTAFVYKGE